MVGSSKRKLSLDKKKLYIIGGVVLGLILLFGVLYFATDLFKAPGAEGVFKELSGAAEEAEDSGDTTTGEDSDGDGLTDTEEASTYSTNPNNNDSDNDSVDDGTEVAEGTDPTDEYNVTCTLITKEAKCHLGSTCGGGKACFNKTDYEEWQSTSTSEETATEGGNESSTSSASSHTDGAFDAKSGGSTCYCLNDTNNDGEIDTGSEEADGGDGDTGEEADSGDGAAGEESDGGGGGSSGGGGGSGGPTCGDGVIEGDEECDPNATHVYGNKTCSDFGYNFGNLTCKDCSISTKDCKNVTLKSCEGDKPLAGNWSECKEGEKVRSVPECDTSTGEWKMTGTETEECEVEVEKGLAWWIWLAIGGGVLLLLGGIFAVWYFVFRKPGGAGLSKKTPSLPGGKSLSKKGKPRKKAKSGKKGKTGKTGRKKSEL